MKSKRSVLAALATTTALLLSGCSATSGASSGPVTVTMWARAATAPVTKALVSKFNASQKKVKVVLTVLPLNQEDAKFAAAVRSGSVPDIFGMNDISIPQYVRTGALRSLTDFEGGLSYKSALNAGQVNLATYNNQVYAIPLMLDLSVLWYNKTLFSKAGLDPAKAPSSASEIIADAKKISALGGGVKGYSFAGNCGGCNVFTIAPMLYAAKEYDVTGPVGKQSANIQNNAELKRVLTMLRTMQTDGSLAPGDKTEDGSTFGADFLSGKVGITTNGLGTVLNGKRAAFDLGVGGIPDTQGTGVSTFSGGDEFVLPSAGQHAAEAEQFIKFALEPAQQNSYPKYGYTPVRTDVLTPAFSTANPDFAVALNAAKTGYAPNTTAFQSLYSNSGPWGPIFQTATFGGDITGALKTGQAGFESILKTANSSK